MTRWHDDEFRELENRLRGERPEPRPEFLERMTARLEQGSRPERRRSPRLRLGLAFAFASTFLLAFSLAGGLGYAKNATYSAFKSTAGAFGVEGAKSERSSSRGAAAAGTAAKGSEHSRSDEQPGTGGNGSSGKGDDGSEVGEGTAAAGAASLGSWGQFDRPSATPSHFQYPRFVVVCLQFGHRQFTAVVPRFLIPLIRPFIVNFGPCHNGRRVG